eukprot:TRINITY_DN8890_c0_g1_i1.p2 TRINITY_DN8890_c0_g1~~TRINITY_DN8890_c0_g1_i1.p2  ORF type:complete len:101 (+),score=15.59 TRINITY_DN8890_c0_g1_i1:137-439(+)
MASVPEGDANKPPESTEEESRVKQICFCILDTVALIVRTLVAIGKCIKYTTSRCFYPFKEAVLGCYDAVGRWYSPYKSKLPRKGVPSFQFGIPPGSKQGP